MNRWERKAPDFYLMQNDTSPSVAFQLIDGTGTPISLVGASVKFFMYAPGAASAKVNAAATITDSGLGKVSYTPTASNTDTPGDYLAQFQVTFASSAVETFPNGDHLKIRVMTDLAA